MLARRVLVMGLILLVSLVGVSACAPGVSTSSSRVTVAPSPTPEVMSDQGQDIDVVVEVTPMPDEELADQPPEQVDPAPSAEEGEAQVASTAQSESDTLVVYGDSLYGFSLAYPSDYLFETLSAEQLRQFTPIPTAAFTIMNPVTAASDVVDLEPADLQIFVFSVQEVGSLDNLLTMLLLGAADDTTQFDTSHVSGVEVCDSPMLAPGCSYFVTTGKWIFRLIPATLEGEAMKETFRLIQ
jgi:hypothetical protein